MLKIDLWKRVLIWGVVLIGLLLAAPNGFYTRVETHNDALQAIERGEDAAQYADDVAMWPSWAPCNPRFCSSATDTCDAAAKAMFTKSFVRSAL